MKRFCLYLFLCFLPITFLHCGKELQETEEAASKEDDSSDSSAAPDMLPTGPGGIKKKPKYVTWFTYSVKVTEPRDWQSTDDFKKAFWPKEKVEEVFKEPKTKFCVINLNGAINLADNEEWTAAEANLPAIKKSTAYWSEGYIELEGADKDKGVAFQHSENFSLAGLTFSSAKKGDCDSTKNISAFKLEKEKSRRRNY